MTDPRDNLEPLLRRHYAGQEPRPEFVRRLESQLVEELHRADGSNRGCHGGRRLPPCSQGRFTHARRRLLAAAAVVALAVGLALAVQSVHQRRVADRLEIARLQGEVGARESELQLRTAGIKRLMVIERRRNVEERLALIHLDPAPLERVAAERERAAATMVATADLMYRELNLHASAIEKYRRAVDLFPDTRGAVTAKERLSEIQPG